MCCFWLSLKRVNTVLYVVPPFVKVPSSAGFATLVYGARAFAAASHTKKAFCSPVSGSSAAGSSAWSRTSFPVDTSTRYGKAVCAAMNASSYQPPSTMAVAMPRNSAASVPGVMGIHSSDFEAVVEKCGSTVTILAPASLASKNRRTCGSVDSQKLLPTVSTMFALTQSRASPVA